MQKRGEELVRKNEWYKWYRHLVGSGGVVTERYVIEDGRDVLYLRGFDEEKKVVLAKSAKDRSDQYVELCDWVKCQNVREIESQMTDELRAAEAYADSVGMSFGKQPEELMKSMLGAMRQLADRHNIDLDELFQENRYSM